MVPLRQNWPALRAAAISVVLAFNLLAALPKPGRLDASLLARPEAQLELTRWASLFASVGLPMDEDTLGALTIQVSNRWLAARRWALAPYQPILDVTQTQQGWSLFAYPDRSPTRFEIAWRPDQGEWRVIYLTGHPTQAWTAGRFRYRRVRAMYNPGAKMPPPLVGLTRALTAEWGQAEPSATELRFRLLQKFTDLPGERPRRIPVERWKKLNNVERSP